MKNGKRIKLLIVDDSLFFRELLASELSFDPYIEVVAKATDPFDARDKILEFLPDVMICDVEMPKMNGIEFLRRLLPQYPMPVVVVSTISESIFDAMDAGAVDFVTKPMGQSEHQIKEFITNLINKIKIAASSKVIFHKTGDLSSNKSIEKIPTERIIAIGSSTGGTEALSSILKVLPADLPGILIAQHIPPLFSKMFADRVNNQTGLQVMEARDGDYVEQGKVLIAPGGKHMKVTKKMGSRYQVEVYEGDKVNGHCPSVDVLFESVARIAGKKAIGIILTGMGYDGAKGLLSIRRKGGRTIGQDEMSSVVYGMPKVAYDIGAIEKQVSLERIPQQLLAMLKSV